MTNLFIDVEGGCLVVLKEICYFERPGPQNTEDTVRLARERCKELGLKNLVVATTSGLTALKVSEEFGGLDVEITAVTLHAGAWAEYEPPDRKKVEELRQRGVHVLTSTHALMGSVDTAIKRKFGGLPPTEIISRTLYLFSQGMKVCVEISLMAADAGLIPMNSEVIAIAGSDKGADTAVIIKSASTRNIFDLEIREIICMPRKKC